MDHDKRRLALTCNLSNEYFIRQAKSRWLRPSEICEILRGHNRFNLTVDPPHKPPSGSLFLFDRKVLRYFRKDGHCWRKKKDGRTVSEAHEKIKAGNVDALHCYYAHGEDSKDFQRRIYWLLDEKLENIVLVHYRDLSEENRISADTDPTIFSQESYSSSAVSSALLRSSNFAVQESYPSRPSTADCPQTPSGFQDANSENECGTFAANECSRNDRTQISTAEHSGLIGLFDGESFSHFAVPSCMWREMLRSDQESGGMHDITTFEPANCPDDLTETTADSILNKNVNVGFAFPAEYNVLPNAHLQSIRGEGKAELQETTENSVYISSPLCGKNLVDCSGPAYRMPDDHYLHRDTQFNKDSVSQTNIPAMDHPLEYKTDVSLVPKNSPRDMEWIKLDSFGRWMDEVISKDCDDSVMTPGSFWNDIETESGDTELTSLSHHMHLDIDRVGPSLQDKLYSILDFSPDWAFSGDETKF